MGTPADLSFSVLVLAPSHTPSRRSDKDMDDCRHYGLPRLSWRTPCPVSSHTQHDADHDQHDTAAISGIGR